jgi:hypothetical protein
MPQKNEGPIKIPLPFDEALSGLLKVNPHPMVEQVKPKKAGLKKKASTKKK